ncbi:hypothetical protein P3S67_010440 [Capsicum chacoense]
MVQQVINSESEENLEEHISRYVLHMESEEELTQVMVNKRDGTPWMMKIGRKQQPKHLMELLQKLTDFSGVGKFDIDQFQEPPIGWKMPIVTLTTIATTIPNVDHKIVDSLLLSVSQGLNYVSFIEDVLGTNENSEKGKRAADVAWLELYLYRRWFDQDLQKMALQGKITKEILQNFANIAQNYVAQLKDENTKVVAANCILGACFIDMPYAITKKCSASAIEKREENVQHAIHLLGEAEEIIKSLQQHAKVTPTNSSNSDSHSSSSDEIQIALE